jgi:hypothetical protein
MLVFASLAEDRGIFYRYMHVSRDVVAPIESKCRYMYVPSAGTVAVMDPEEEYGK